MKKFLALTILLTFIFAPPAFADGTCESLLFDLGKGEGTSSVRIEMVKIPAGSFKMGSQADLKGRGSDETFRAVTISKDFYMGKYEVTQGQWTRIMKFNPSRFNNGDDYPVETVSWDECREFIEKLNKALEAAPAMSPLAGKFRMPTEAEWEYACRAGSATAFYWGDTFADDYCWCDCNSGETTHPTGRKKPNAWGLYDMSGNVFECCADFYSIYSSDAATDPAGPAAGRNRVARGGSWRVSAARNCRSAARHEINPSPIMYFDPGIGLRLVFVPAR